MSCLEWRGKNFILLFAVGVGILLWCEAPRCAEPADSVEPYKGVREATLRYVAFGTPGDLLRLREAFERTEQEIARLKLDIPQRGQEEFAQEQKRLKDLKHRRAESDDLLRLLGISEREIPDRELDHLGTQERASLRRELSARIKDLNVGIDVLEKSTNFEQAEHLRILVDERNALARLVAARREQLLADYAKMSECTMADRPCLQRRLKMLCELKLLFAQAERAPVLHLIREIDGQLNLTTQRATEVCEYSQYDFKP